MTLPAAPRLQTALLGLGANLGDPGSQLGAAVAGLRSRLADLRVSGVYRTPPEGGREQPDYLNAVVGGGWAGTAQELLDVTMYNHTLN